MQLSRNKTAATMIALFLVLTIAVILPALPAANAHTPPWQIPTFVYVMPAPKIVGVGQYMTFVIWNTQLPPGSLVTNDIRWRGFKLILTKPSGDTETLGPFTSDSTGSTYTSYTPDQAGNWTVKLIFPAQVVTTTGVFANDTWLESTYTTSFVVQQEPVPESKVYPLPTEFWTRPIEGQNEQWYKIASNWLRGVQVGGVGGSSDRAYQPDGIGPNSGHIMWTKPLDFAGGIVGGTHTAIEGEAWYDGSFYNLRFSPIIMNGKLYYQLPLCNSGGGGGFMCRDLVTGEEIWYTDQMGVSGSSAPSFGYIYSYEHYNQHGAIPPGLLFTSNFARAVDPSTGKFLFNVTNVPSGTEALGPAGEILRYAITNIGNTTVPNWRLTQWNSSKVFDVQTSGSLNASYASRYDWNISLTVNFATSPTIQAIMYEDLLLGSNGTAPSRGGDPDTRPPYVTFWAINLKPASRGQLLWMKNIPGAPNNMTMYWPPRAMADGVFVLNIKETQQWLGYDMRNGNLLWGPTEPETNYNPYAYFSGTVAVTQVCTTAYGKFFSAGYSGMVFCYDLYNGSLLWRYEAPTNKSVWNYYSLNPLAIADGKLYLGTQEHSSSKPLYKGNLIRALDVNTGKEVWTLMGWGGLHSGAVADGYLVYYNCYDNQIYCIGKGPSATTVTAPDIGVPAGSSVMIRGTVTDQSPGAKAKGTAAVSDASMGDWMAYMYMQKPRPTNTIGVNVTLDAIDPNNNSIHIGTATSDSNGLFSYQWTPPADIPGKYTVIATFAGSESYWPSFAETAVGVDPAPPAPPAPEPAPPMPPFDMYILVATVAIIIAVAIATILLLRKRP